MADKSTFISNFLYDFKIRITEFRVNGNLLKFGKNNDQHVFAMDGNKPECDEKMHTAFIRIQNEKLIASSCTKPFDKDDHLKYNKEIRNRARLLSLQYTFSRQPWGDIYYKLYDQPMYYQKAHEKCENDGTSLPIPLSGLFNFMMK